MESKEKILGTFMLDRKGSKKPVNRSSKEDPRDVINRRWKVVPEHLGVTQIYNLVMGRSSGPFCREHRCGQILISESMDGEVVGIRSSLSIDL
jgi:hypothetical protein